MSTPLAGWYADPADPGQQRWWGGVEWTHDVRPLPAPQPALQDVPGGGINPFAAVDAQEQQQSAFTPHSSYAEPVSPYAQAQPAWQGQVQPAWQAAPHPAYGPPPSNGFATAGLILSLFGMYGLGIFFSIRGLLHANKLARWGDEPVGRKRAGWGLGISIVAPLTIAALLSILIPVGIAQSENMASDGVVRGAFGIPAVYDREIAEQAIYDGFAETGQNVSEVTCPDEAEMVVGGGFECSIFYLSMTRRVGIVYTDTAGGYYMTLDGLILE